MGAIRRSAPRIYELGVTLSDVEPPVWRRLRVSSGATLSRAARIVALSMGWPPGRPYVFHVGGLEYARQPPGVDRGNGHAGSGAPAELRLRQVLPDAGAELELEYGNGHPWHLQVRLERLLPPNDDVFTPWCEAGGGASPPMDVGGPWAWEERRTAGLGDDASEIAPGFNRDAVNAEFAGERRGRRG